MTAPLRILIVGDERVTRDAMAHQLRAAGYLAEPVETALAALERLEAPSWDVVMTDLRMTQMDGIALLKEVKRRAPDVDVVITTACGTLESAVAAMREGAADYVTKPFRFPELDLRLRRLAELRSAKRELARLRAMLAEDDARYGVLGRSPGILRVRDRVRLFKDSVAPVLITGETGTGKELVARALHELGPRKAGPFVAIPCGAIPRELADSQLLGYEKGAFPGAIARHKGFFEEADDGTLMLGDVDDLPIDIQVTLVRLLEQRTIRRMGGAEEIDIDVRVIATTKVDLSIAVERGHFRDDLYYRLRGLEIHLPPLRDRGDDVILLAQHFLRRLASAPGERPKTLTPQAADLLRRYAWPGNVRELRRIMESAVATCRGSEIDVSHLPPYVEAESRSESLFALHFEHCEKIDLPQLVTKIEHEAIRWAMAHAHGQQTRAAELLCLPRTTLQSKIGRLL